MKNIIPALEWISSYNSTLFKGDLGAGLTVGIMLIPQGMAYAMIAGMPPIYGLYAATIPLIIYALMGTSRQLAVGPVAMVSLLTATGVSTLAESGTSDYIAMAIMLAAMVGAIQLLLGIFRLGFLVNFLSHPVISGFTSAAALIIGLSQLKHLLGVSIPRSHHIHEILIEAIKHIGDVHLWTLAIGIGGILIIVLLRRWKPAFPSALVVVVLGIVIVALLRLDLEGVKILGDIPSGLPTLRMPRGDLSLLQSLLPSAMAISLVGFMESMAVAKKMQSKHKNYALVPNQELVALGSANLIGSVFQSFPVTGGFSRTAVNDQAGASTGAASMISAVFIVLTLLFLTPLFYYLPQALLASIIMVAVFGLIDFEEAKHLWKLDRKDFWMLAVTFIATLIIGIEAGIGVGVLLSLAMILYKTAYPHYAELGRLPGSHHYRNLKRFDDLETWPEILILRFDAQLYFANSNNFKSIVEEHMEQRGPSLRFIILHFDGINSIDSSAIHVLRELATMISSTGQSLLFCSVKGPVRDKLERSGLTASIGSDHFFMNPDEATSYAMERI